jgi:hypothetical protein
MTRKTPARVAERGGVKALMLRNPPHVDAAARKSDAGDEDGASNVESMLDAQ